MQLILVIFVTPGARVRKVISHPTEQSWIISAVQGNNEISMWDLETDQRQMVLWASSAPPLSHTQTGHTVCTMYAGSTDCSSFLLAGGTDMRLRFWDLNMPTASYIALPAANDVLTPNTLAYELVSDQIENRLFHFVIRMILR